MNTGPSVEKLLCLPWRDGWPMPERAHPPDCFDFLALRAIVHPTEMAGGFLRRTVFDLTNGFSPYGNDEGRINLDHIQFEGGEWVYYLHPGEKVNIGLGVSLFIPHGYAGFVKPRGSAIDAGLAIVNSDVPIDHGYTGEPKAVVRNNGDEPYRLRRKSCICQLAVVRLFTGPIAEVSGYDEYDKLIGLTCSARGCGQSNSTGRSV